MAALERLKNGQGQIHTELGRLKNCQAQLHTGLGRFENGQAQFYADLTARMDQLATATEARLDVQDEVLSRFRGDLVDELSRTRSALVRQVRRLEEEIRISRGGI